MQARRDCIKNFRLSRQELERLRAVAVECDLTTTQIIRHALRGYLKKYSRQQRRGSDRDGSGQASDALAG